ncbi:MAG: hypothetical protein EWM47_02075 [Anaerolineaceae bacterium]|nr:MAG: hypothetical protein EWM47_02075 [Anaerolineaceae bacterium]
MNKIKASFTIEAVFIMPIVIFAIIFIIYLSFYLHDYCKMQGITNGVLHKATMNLKHETDIGTGKVNYDEINKGLISQIFESSDSKEKEIEDYTIKLLSKSLIATKITDVHVSKGILNLSIKVEGKFQFPLKGLLWIIPFDKTLLVEIKSAYHYPANSIRLSEVILDTGSKIKGFDKIKESIEKLMPK